MSLCEKDDKANDFQRIKYRIAANYSNTIMR